MNIYRLLYSRSLTKDYRWILRPDILSMEDLKILNELYDWFDRKKDNKFAREVNFAPIFCLNLSRTSVLFCCSKTDFSDNSSRNIYCMQGFAVVHEDKKEFCATLPYLLDDYQNKLDAWRWLNFNQVDKMDNEIRKEEINFYALQSLMSPMLAKLQQLEHVKIKSFPTFVTCSPKGFEEFLQILVSPNVPLVDFAYGITQDILHDFPTFSLVALIGKN